MGDEILKTYIKIFCCLLLGLSVSLAKDNVSSLNDTKGYDQLFEKLAEKRVGVDYSTILALANPFDSISKEDVNQTAENTEPSYALKAIVSTRAKINDTWYMVNDQVGNYTLVSIADNSAILKNDTEKKTLYIRNKNDSKVKISSK